MEAEYKEEEERENLTEKQIGDEENSGDEAKRGYWKYKAEFILACIGNCCGPNAWVTFPYLCYSNGGLPVFLIPYCVMLLHIGLPMMLLEMYLGQYSSQGILTVWGLCPLFKGIGFTLLLYVTGSLFSIPQFISWIIHYATLAFSKSWMRCDNPWNSDYCLSHQMPNSTLEDLMHIGYQQVGKYTRQQGWKIYKTAGMNI